MPLALAGTLSFLLGILRSAIPFSSLPSLAPRGYPGDGEVEEGGMGAGISEKSPRIGNLGALAATSTSDDAGPCANCQGLSQIQRPRPHRGSRPAIWSREFTILFVSSSGYETRAALQVSWSSQRIPLSSFALTSGPTPAAAGALRGMRGSPNAVTAFPPSTCALGEER